MKVYYFNFPWAEPILDIVIEASKTFVDDTVPIENRSYDLPDQLIIIDGIANSLAALKESSGIFLLPFQFPLDVMNSIGAEMTKEYVSFLRALEQVGAEERKYIIGITGTVSVGSLRTMHKWPAREWNYQCITTWILPPTDPWHVILAIEQLVYRRII